MMHTKEEKMAAFGRLLDILDILRVKCPWDKKQTNESLRPNTIEETYELCDALIKQDDKNICKELGDVLLHVCFYAKIASEKGVFDMSDVCNQLCDKLVFRHPHVFHKQSTDSGAVVKTEQDVSEQWERIKQTEKDGNRSVLSGVPDSLPSIIKAYRIQEKAHNVGFDWNDESHLQVWEKVKEEISEFEEEVHSSDKNRARISGEFGDLLFSLINVARHLGINPDNALELTNQKFIKRFNYIEVQSLERGKHISDLSLDEMNSFWEQAKQLP